MPATSVRRDEWGDAVFQAIAVLRAHMNDPAQPTALKAATEVVRLETTRMRHGVALAGTTVDTSEPPAPAERPTGPLADALDRLVDVLPADLSDAEWEAAALAALGLAPPSAAGQGSHPPGPLVPDARVPCSPSPLRGGGRGVG